MRSKRENNMLLSYPECIQLYESKYNLKKKIAQGELFRLEKGIYADKKYVPEFQIISKKYPAAIFDSRMGGI